LAALGLSAIDPIGIGVMPVLLVQKRPYRRVLAFLGGSFVSLMVMGLLFAKGLGQAVLRFEHGHSWFVPTVERVAGVVLLAIAVTLYLQLRAGKASIEPSGRTRRWLELGGWQLFALGALLVAVQSVIDVVFVIAMVRVGQFKLSGFMLAAAVATYAVTALILQIAVVGAFRFAPSRQKTKTLETVHVLLAKYSYQALIAVSLLLGCVLFVIA
jgi:hypothetical protein